MWTGSLCWRGSRHELEQLPEVRAVVRRYVGELAESGHSATHALRM